MQNGGQLSESYSIQQTQNAPWPNKGLFWADTQHTATHYAPLTSRDSTCTMPQHNAREVTVLRNETDHGTRAAALSLAIVRTACRAL